MPHRSLTLLLLSGTILVGAIGWDSPLDAQQQQPRTSRPGFPTAPPRDRPPEPTTTATLRGRVTRADTGQPLRRAHVTAAGGRSTAQSGQRPQSWVATTDADGYYELTDLPPGRYSLSARKGSFVSLQYGQRRVGEPGTPIALTGDEVLDELDFRLPRGGVVTGRIFDEFSEPATGVAVTVLTRRYVQGRRELSPAGRSRGSDDRGQFRIYGLPPGQYWVSAAVRDFQSSMAQTSNSQGYAPTFYPGTANVAEAQMLTLDLGQELTGIDYVLVPVRTASVSGTATDAQGRPFANAMIMVSPQRSGGMITTFGGNQTDANGRFVVSNLTPGTYTLRLMGSGLRFEGGTATTTVTVNGADVTGLYLAATLGTTVRGIVVTEHGGMPGFPVSGVQVRTQPVDFNQFRMARPARVNDDGTFELEGLTDNDLIRVTGLPPEWGLKAVRFRSADVTDRALTSTELSVQGTLEVVVTDRLTHLSGSVTDAGGLPALDYTVVVFPDARDRWTYPTRSVQTARPDQDGVFKIDGLPAGRYYAVAGDYVPPQAWTSPEYLEQLSPWTTSFELGDGQTEALSLRLANLEGAVW